MHGISLDSRAFFCHKAIRIIIYLIKDKINEERSGFYGNNFGKTKHSDRKHPFGRSSRTGNRQRNIAAVWAEFSSAAQEERSFQRES